MKSLIKTSPKLSNETVNQLLDKINKSDKDLDIDNIIADMLTTESINQNQINDAEAKSITSKSKYSDLKNIHGNINTTSKQINQFPNLSFKNNDIQEYTPYNSELKDKNESL
jgi:hypothetical protein